MVEEILVERNFPTATRQEASEGVGVMHPGVVEEFREAQRTYRGVTGSEGGADLEEMRQAIVGSPMSRRYSIRRKESSTACSPRRFRCSRPSTTIQVCLR